MADHITSGRSDEPGDASPPVRAKVYVVDDDAAARELMLRLLVPTNVDVVPFASAVEFLAQYDDTDDAPRCVILDLVMPTVDGSAVHEHLKSRGCSVPIICVSGLGDVPAAVEAMQRGAFDFLPKPVVQSRLVSAVGQAVNRDFSDRLRHVKAMAMRRMVAKLTAREHEVMELLGTGLDTKAIGKQLDISVKTVFVHRARILEKLGLDNLVQLSHFLADI